ncbi:DinB family protein [Desertimonas flava]|uniref:DinB family protein n=1 Tax=Desertimonas flava TaxID=2064846 RepID=UPI000E348FD8|nr:DinB family protein [Desertimonas flava]
MAIEPDTKDWTWVLQRPCPECGFEAAGVTVRDVPRLVRDNASVWAAVLRRDDVGVRPQPQRWSALEYACHVRDVFALFDTRLHLMLDEEGPRFANWDQDETAERERYGDQDPATVSADLATAAAAVAESFAAVTEDQYGRSGVRSDGAEFTVATFAQYFVHDPIHHLWDVGEEQP